MITLSEENSSEQAWIGTQRRGLKKNGTSQQTKSPETTPVVNTESSSNISTPVSGTGTHENERRKARYCHYYVNYGKCSYEEKTGNKCRFLHETVTICKDGTQCHRNKCMFTHPKPGNAAGF